MKAAVRIMRLLGVTRQPEHPDVDALERLGIFDRDGYLKRNPDVAASGVDPILHFATVGAWEGRKPCDYFDPAFYLEENPDVAAVRINPLLHFFSMGWRESRHPSREFDLDWYANAHLKQREDTNPLMHYLSEGRALGLEVRAVQDPALELVRRAGVFDSDYYLSTYEDVAESGVDPLRHYMGVGFREGRNPSAFFDTTYYFRNNPDVASEGRNPLLHFCEEGWRELRNPSPDFDVWWYWSMYLDPASDEINPLGHYLTTGQGEGLQVRPPTGRAGTRKARKHASGRGVRRICMFAGYDRDGIVDEYVVDYVREIAKYADVYYLADCELADGELEKLSAYVKGAWGHRHGRRDFGSWSELVERVGWELIEQYDELVLVNDSCYLLRGLDEVFDRMDGRACDWWGLQATKGTPATKQVASNRFLWPIPINDVRESLVESFEADYQYDFLIGSYFIAYRRTVLADERFRKMLRSVVAQESEQRLVLKYEAGFTRHLIAFGYVFDTFVDALYPYHPLLGDWHFRLLDHGFPLLKRRLLADTRLDVQSLHLWRQRVWQSIPGADLRRIESNLERVLDPGLMARLAADTTAHDLGLEESLASGRLLTEEEFVLADARSPKHGHWWAFPVCGFTRTFSGNERAVFEEVKEDAGIRKIVFTRGKPVEVGGQNVDVVDLDTPEGQRLLMGCGNIFVRHTPSSSLVYPVLSGLHNIINLWHGVPFKRIGYVSADLKDMLHEVAAEHLKCRAVISSSRVDSLAMSAAFYPLSPNDVWNTGLPRNDFILRDEEKLPEDMRREAAELERMLGGRRLILFMPTFRNAHEDGSYRFNSLEKGELFDWLSSEDVILGIREHMADAGSSYSSQLSGQNVIDLAVDRFPNVEILYRKSSALVTDYSSCFIDYMLTGKPAVSFAYDYANYVHVERGAFYDLENVFPGPVCRNFEQLMSALTEVFSEHGRQCIERSMWVRSMFFDRIDDRNSARVVAKVQELIDLHGIGVRHGFG